jgi:hypothetical protein
LWTDTTSVLDPLVRDNNHQSDWLLRIKKNIHVYLYAATMNDWAQMQICIQNDPNVIKGIGNEDMSNYNCYSAMELATRHGHVEILRNLKKTNYWVLSTRI